MNKETRLRELLVRLSLSARHAGACAKTEALHRIQTKETPCTCGLSALLAEIDEELDNDR